MRPGGYVVSVTVTPRCICILHLHLLGPVARDVGSADEALCGETYARQAGRSLTLDAQ